LINCTYSFKSERDPLCWRIGAVVLLLHAALAWVWLSRPEQTVIAVNELSVSIVMQPAETEKPHPPHLPQQQAERTDKPVLKPVVREVAEIAPNALATAALPTEVLAAQTAAVAPPVDTDPDYQAAYLNNPRPVYPMVARRMGWQGLVMLNVEVLAEGACGRVNVQHSSGHEVLDNAAMNTVRSWRFTPARHAGRASAQWFRVPVIFSLEDNEA
jgi:periplasmic protein TonB